ncbi:hypothetical protein JCM6882_008518 [Rhodosporidiobolus microsporus]
MAKGSGRFRNRKLGFKTRINVEIGVVIEEDPLDEHLDVEDEKGRKGPETGVDKDEEGEVHLQAVIASTAAYVASSSSSAALDPKGKKKASSSQAHAYIPTRSCVEIPDEEYRALYKSGYVDPFTYIRFSDTIEDVTKGAVAYTMDEDDEDWLEDFNAQFAAPGAKKDDATPAAEDDAPSGRGARAKGKASASADDDSASSSLPGPLSEDGFELVMEVFELVTDAKAPMAHVNLDLLPAVTDFEYAFHDPLKPHLAKLWPYAKDVHPHWRERRVQRKGRWVIPQLDYDESNENNPYVCFRRRELKTSRKTRRSDQQNLERLIRLRNDLYAAHALMEKVSERERLKLDAIQLERKVFEERCEVRELKRRLNEPDGDEELLISRREKKRKRDDPMAGSLRLSLRKPDPSNLSPAALVPPLEELQARKQRNDALVKQIERDLAKKRQGDQHWDDWTDSSFLARPPPTPARFWRSVEPVPHTVPFNGPAGRREALGFATNYQPPLGRVRPSFRKRVGRGGRVLLDRISMGGGRDGEPPRKRRLLPLDEETEDEASEPEEEEEEEDEWLAQRRNERLKYDTDVGLDFPLADEPILVDDYELPYLLRRIGLLKQADIEALNVDSSYLDEAFRFVSQDPDKNQPAPVVVGRPPPRPALQVAPSQAAAAVSAGSPMPQGANGGGGVAPGGQQQQQQPNAAAFAQAQQQLAAQQQLRMAQQQAAMRKQQQVMAAAAAAAAGGPPGAGGDMRRTPSQQGSPVAGAAQAPMGQMPMGMPNGQPSPVGQFHASLPGGFPSQGSPLGANGLPLHPPPPGQQQQRPNGLPAGSSPQPQQLLNINGANGLPATSRLSAPPFSNNAALQMALQAQQQQQLAAAIAANGGSPISLQQLQQVQQAQAQAHAQAQGRPMSANGALPPPGVLPPSRPTSAASAHTSHSPHLGGAGGNIPLPAMSPTAAANLRANGAAGTPPPNVNVAAMGKRSSPMAPVNGLGPGGYAALQAQAQAQGMGLQKQGQYGGFVQG